MFPLHVVRLTNYNLTNKRISTVLIRICCFICLLSGSLEVYRTAKMTVVNYCIWVLGAGLILFIIVALLVIYYIHKKRQNKEKMQKMLSRRRKATDYRRPDVQTPVESSLALWNESSRLLHSVIVCYRMYAFNFTLGKVCCTHNFCLVLLKFTHEVLLRWNLIDGLFCSSFSFDHLVSLSVPSYFVYSS